MDKRVFFASKKLSQTLSGTKYALTAGMLSATGLGSFNASQMIDGIAPASNGGYPPAGVTAGNAVLTILFGSGQQPGRVRLYNYNATTAGTWKVQITSDGGSSWADAGSNVITSLANNWNVFDWVNAGGGNGIRIINTATTTGQGWWCEVEVYMYV